MFLQVETVLSSIPTKNHIDTLITYVKEPEKLVIIENVVYLYCPNGYGKSKVK